MGSSVASTPIPATPSTATASTPAPAGPQLVGANVQQGFQGFQDYQDSQRPYKDQQRPTAGAEAKLKLSLESFVEFAIEQQRLVTDEEIPRERYQSELFEFVRYCRAHRDLENLPSHEAVRRVDRVLCKLLAKEDVDTRRHFGSDAWAFFFDVPAGSAMIRFQSNWESVVYIPLHDALFEAKRLAEKRTWRPTPDRGDLYARFASVAFYLQAATLNGVILLPVERVGELLGCDGRTISRMRDLAIKDGLLERVEAHNFRRGKATVFRFIGQFGVGASTCAVH